MRNTSTTLVFSDKKVWYNELTAEIASQNHPPQAASAAVLKDLIMKSWEKTLHLVQTFDEAHAAADEWNKTWRTWGVKAADARMTKSVTTNTTHYELHTFKEAVVLPGRKQDKIDAGGNVIQIQTWIEAKRLVNRVHVPVTRKRVEKLERGVTGMLNKYRKILPKLEATTEITLTNKQRKYIETVLLANGGWGTVRHGLRRTDTGATAIYIREGNVHIMLFEDGSTTKTYDVPEFGRGSWFFNTKIKRTTPPVVIAAPAFKQEANGAVVLQRYVNTKGV